MIFLDFTESTRKKKSKSVKIKTILSFFLKKNIPLMYVHKFKFEYFLLCSPS